MTDVNQLITEHLDIWTSAIEKKSSAGRGSDKTVRLYGVQKLRELILELAVRGKLVNQDSSDEPSSFLLQRVEKEKCELVKKGKIKSLPKNVNISPDEERFKLPTGWMWTRLEALFTDIHYGYTASADFDRTETRLLRITDIQNGRVNWDTVPGCDIPDRLVEKYLIENDDILIARTGGTIGKSYITQNVTVRSVFASYLIRAKHLASLPSDFVAVFLGSKTYWAQLIEKSAGTGQPNVSASSLKKLMIPLPPLAEQQRIVAKVNELMALCDALEAQTEDSLKAHQTLVETCLATLTNSQSPEDLTQNWTRVEDHFDTLITTGGSIEALGKTILELGAMGRLSSPLEVEVTASEILGRIVKAKSRLVALGEARREKPLERHDPEKVPFALPEGWVWAKIGDVALFTQYGTSKKAAKLSEGVPVLAMGNIQAGEVSLESDKHLPHAWEEFPSLLLQPGDLLYNRTNSAELVGKTGLFDGPEDAYTFASYLIRIRLDHSLVRPKYLNFIMNSPYFRATQIVPKIKKQTGQANVNGTFLKNMLIPLPPTEEQDYVIERIEELNKVCGSLRTQSGQIDVLQRVMADTLTSKIH